MITHELKDYGCDELRAVQLQSLVFRKDALYLYDWTFFFLYLHTRILLEYMYSLSINQLAQPESLKRIHAATAVLCNHTVINHFQCAS